MKNVLVMLALVTGCAGTPTDDDVLDFPIDDGKGDSFWSQVKMHGNLTYDTPVHLTFSPTPDRYWGYKLVGTFDDQLDVTMRSDDGYPAMSLYDANKTPLESNWAHRDWPPHIAHVSVPLAASGTVYLVISELDDHAAHFDLTATHAPICHPAVCTSDQCGIVQDGCGAQESCGACLPTTPDPRCTALGISCGHIFPPDTELECSRCTGGTSCGGAGVAGACGVTAGHDWLADIPRNDVGNWSGHATFTLGGIGSSGEYDVTTQLTGTITCDVFGIPGHGLPTLYCHGPHGGTGLGSLHSDGSFSADAEEYGTYNGIKFAGTIEPHGRIRITELSERYLVPTNAVHEWAFPCMLTRKDTCAAGTTWRTSATATLQLEP